MNSVTASRCAARLVDASPGPYEDSVMSEQVLATPNLKTNESGVSVYSKEDEKFVGWSSLPAKSLVRVAFPENDAPTFATRERADLVFTGNGDIRLFVPKAQVVRCEYVPGQTTYTFEVRETQWENIRESLSPRRSVRVSPKEPIELEIDSQSGQLKGRVEDISETGISVTLDASLEAELLRLGPHSLRFSLSPGEEPIELLAKLRYRALEGESELRCGFEFDTQSNPDYRQTRWHVARFVWMQQDDPRLPD